MGVAFCSSFSCNILAALLLLASSTHSLATFRTDSCISHELFGFAPSRHLLYFCGYHIYRWDLPFSLCRTLICTLSIFSADIAIRYRRPTGFSVLITRLSNILWLWLISSLTIILELSRCLGLPIDVPSFITEQTISSSIVIISPLVVGSPVIVMSMNFVWTSIISVMSW